MAQQKKDSRTTLIVVGENELYQGWQYKDTDLERASRLRVREIKAADDRSAELHQRRIMASIDSQAPIKPFAKLSDDEILAQVASEMANSNRLKYDKAMELYPKEGVEIVGKQMPMFEKHQRECYKLIYRQWRAGEFSPRRIEFYYQPELYKNIALLLGLFYAERKKVIEILRLDEDRHSPLAAASKGTHYKASIRLLKPAVIESAKSMEDIVFAEIQKQSKDQRFVANNPVLPKSATVPDEVAGSSPTVEPVFPLPAGTKWEDVFLRFHNSQEVELVVKKERKGIFSYRALGFEDTRAKLPNEQWRLLEKLSKHHGDAQLAELQLPRHGANNFSKQKELLSKILKKTFGIADNPFFDYRIVKSHKARFALEPEADSKQVSAGDVEDEERDPRLEGMEDQLLG